MVHAKLCGLCAKVANVGVCRTIRGTRLGEGRENRGAKGSKEEGRKE